MKPGSSLGGIKPSPAHLSDELNGDPGKTRALPHLAAGKRKPAMSLATRWRSLLSVIATITNSRGSTHAERRFQGLYLRTATIVSPEEQILVELYAGGGGSSLFVQEGWVGRLAAMNAAIWAEVMKLWLQQNPNATRQDNLLKVESCSIR